MIYGGVRDAQGKVILPGWPVGSEMQLALLVGGNEPFPVATSYFRELVYAGQPGWDWKVSDYGKEWADAKAYGAGMLDVPASGLAPFFARGGKLLMSHGWTDGLIPANNSVLFYTNLLKAIPGRASAGPGAVVHGPRHGPLRRRRRRFHLRHARHDRRVGDERQGARADRRHPDALAQSRTRRSCRRSAGRCALTR